MYIIVQVDHYECIFVGEVLSNNHGNDTVRIPMHNTGKEDMWANCAHFLSSAEVLLQSVWLVQYCVWNWESKGVNRWKYQTEIRKKLQQVCV